MKFVETDIVEQECFGSPALTYLNGRFRVVKKVGARTEISRAGTDSTIDNEVRYDLNKTLVENLQNTPEDRKWSVNQCTLDGDEEQMLSSFCNGTLKMVTDGSHHKDFGLATAAIYVEATDGANLKTVLLTPGNEYDLQSHRAEPSGHFAIITIFEVLESWTKAKNIPLQKYCAKVACDNKELLRIY